MGLEPNRAERFGHLGDSLKRIVIWGLAGPMASCAFASVAHSQQLDVDVTVQRTASTPGMLQVVQGAPVTTTFSGASGPFNPTGGPVTITSAQSPNLANDVPLYSPGVNGLPPSGTFSFFDLSPEPGEGAAFYHEKFHVGTLNDLTSILRNGSDTSGTPFHFSTPPYVDRCGRYGQANLSFGVDVGITAGPCDAVDLKLAMNGVGFELTAPENKSFVTLSIPSLGYTFTGDDLSVITRRDSLSRISDNFFASGNAPALERALLNKPAGFTLAEGSLPTGSKLLAAMVELKHSDGTVTTRSFGVDSLGELVAFAVANHSARLSTFGLSYGDHCLRSAGAVSGACDGLNAKLRVLGLTAQVTAAPNSPDITFSIPSINYSFTSKNATDRSDAANQFAADAKQNIDFKKLAQQAARDLAVQDGSDPLLGNPNSLQGQLTRSDLDLDMPSASLGETSKEGAGRGGVRELAPSGWMVGGRVGRLSAGSSAGNYVDAVAEYGLRLQEGSQARLKFSAPITVIDYNRDGDVVVTGALRASYEMPLLQNRWVVEPSAAVGAFYGSKDLLNSGAVYALGFSSRYKIAPVGRGHIVIGNAVTYSSTFVIHTKGYSTPRIANTAFRNGVAYQLPIGERMFGRLGTLRASYTYTNLTGDKAFLDHYHEVSLSYGLGSRQVAVRQRAEVLRIGVSVAFGHDYTSGGLVFGYVF